jgi:hypothetical protein
MGLQRVFPFTGPPRPFPLHLESDSQKWLA